MTYVITEKCIKCKYSDCVEVCPVNCFHEGENMLIINPAKCIDCGVCEPECPIGAIEPESEKNLKWLEINKKYSEKWKKDAMPAANKYANEKDKYEKYFKDI